MLQYPLSAPYLVVQKTNWKINFLRTYQIVESVERRSASTSTAVCTHSIYQDSKFLYRESYTTSKLFATFQRSDKTKSSFGAPQILPKKTNKQICFVCREKQRSKQNKFIRPIFRRIYGAFFYFYFFFVTEEILVLQHDSRQGSFAKPLYCRRCYHLTRMYLL